MSRYIKFLDPYNKQDKAIFFGRDTEIDQLYHRVRKSTICILYGLTGTGKTSLIQCGLANKFDETDWFEISIRRGSERTILQAILLEIQKIDPGFTNTSDSPEDLFSYIRKIYLDNYRPIYLVFDQLEELFINGAPEEKKLFIDFIRLIYDYEEKFVTVLFVMREEYIAHLNDFRGEIPSIFNDSIRLERMNPERMEMVARNILSNSNIHVTDDSVIKEIINNSIDPSTRAYELPYLQAYLQRLYINILGDTQFKTDEAYELTINKLPTELVPEDALGIFLNEQIKAILQSSKNAYTNYEIWSILELLITSDGTKRSLTFESISNELSFIVSRNQTRRLLEELKQAQIVRFESGLFELKHDSLAAKILMKLSNEEVSLLDLTKAVIYAQSLNQILTEEQLSKISGLENRLKFNENDRQLYLNYIESCKAHYEKPRKGTKRLIKKSYNLSKTSRRRLTDIFNFSKPVPRWVILLIDLIITGFSFTLSYFVVKQFEFSEIIRTHFLVYTTLYCSISLPVFYFMGMHTPLLRYSNVYDMMRISLAVLITGVLYPIAVVFIVNKEYHINTLNISSVLLINFFISCTLHMMLRSLVRGFYYYIKHMSITGKENVLIYGSGSEAVLIKQAIEDSAIERFTVSGFIDIDLNKANTTIQQKKVYHIGELPLLKNKKQVSKLILLNDQLDTKEKNAVIEKCLQFGIKILTVPPATQWVHGKLSIKELQDLRIEDLLQREPIVVNTQSISEELTGKRILITGAAGSIGAEIVRHVLSFSPELVILCDQAESPLHEIQLEIEEKYPEANIKIFMANVRDRNRIQIPFREYRPHLVFHSAAYKHVPMNEKHPSEAILTNVMGTKILADLSILYHVKKFVLISTDKAMNPTNVMGTSKRIAEMYVQALTSSFNTIADQTIIGLISGSNKPVNNHTKFITTRFGNVLGSNGSVIPRFRQQIQSGGPVTVTHPEITRYFMTIPEAVLLILEATYMGKGGELFTFDMGKPIKIVELAIKMIRLAGLIPDEDIKIVYTGLRPGEKLYEELLNENEKTLPTHHEKIKIVKTIPCSIKVIRDIEDLISMSRLEDNYGIVKKMKDLVPEFKSKNSQYEKLDINIELTSKVKSRN